MSTHEHATALSRSPRQKPAAERLIAVFVGAFIFSLCGPSCRVPQAGAKRRTRDPDAAFADAGPREPHSCDQIHCQTPAECKLVSGLAACVCPKGYFTAKDDPSACEDTDECASGNNDCDVNANCHNRTGGYDCICKDGYTGNGKLCRSLSDCDGVANTCHADAQCTRTDGGVKCTCTTGFSGDGRVCVDIDECAQRKDACPVHARCRNLRSGYACRCDPGFEGNPRVSCRDVCSSAQNDIDRCDPRGRGRCTLSPDGKATCTSCLADSVGDGKVCSVTTECSDLHCPDNTVCAGDAGARRCECAPGFSGDPMTGCVDIDECAQQSDSCDRDQQDCTNTQGGYICSCKDGTERADGGCVDIDECARGLDLCDSAALCKNTDRSYTCECKKGYRGDGYACRDVDECADGGANCIDDGTASCQNTRGSYQCVCPPGYAGDAVHEACYCDLSGYWGMRQKATLELPERRAGNVVLIDRSVTHATIWELHRYTYDGAVIQVQKLQCGSDKVPEIYSPLYMETYSSSVPDKVYEAMPYKRTADIPIDEHAAVPGKPFVTPRDALVRGIHLNDPINDPWPKTYRDVPPEMWEDPDNDAEPGLSLWPGQTTQSTRDGRGTFSYLPVALQDDSTRIETRAGCVSTAVRAIGHLEGTIASCTRLVGTVINDKTEGRVHSCSVLRMADWDTLDVTCRKADWQKARKCNDTQLEFLDEQDQTAHAQADFESVKLGALDATDITCETVRKSLPAF